jgi:catechol 2,3-dioxygenase-like lactoylglutathione lyase family enzyme
MQGLASYMRGLALFAAGVVAGPLILQPSAAQPSPAQENRDAGIRLNHVGISVKNMDESTQFYTKVMGFRVAFKFPSPDGKPTTTYFQVNRDTFLEMAPATADQPPGITHIGIETENIQTTIARIRQAGGTVADSRVSGPTKALLSNVVDPNGIRLELIELTPDSLHKKAEESWK